MKISLALFVSAISIVLSLWVGNALAAEFDIDKNWDFRA